MKQASKQYIPFQPLQWPNRQWPNKTITKAPIWCSVDLRDGNQALVTPMQLEEKLLMFKTLVDIGFKEIEVGFPSASETEYEILRTLIEGHHIPDDVTIQVLVQARPELIKKLLKQLKALKTLSYIFITLPLPYRGRSYLKKICQALSRSQWRVQNLSVS